MFQISESTNVVHFNVEGAKKTDVKVVGTFEEPWFCGRDVCEILEYTNINKALQEHVQQKSKKSLKELSEELGSKTITNSVLGLQNLSIKFPQCQEVVRDHLTTSKIGIPRSKLSYNEGKAVYINEPGLYALIMKSKTQFAKTFQKFVYEQILPSIRKRGRFQLEQTIALKDDKIDELSALVKQMDIRSKETSVKLNELLQKNDELLETVHDLNDTADQQTLQLQTVQHKLGVAVKDRAPLPRQKNKQERFVLIKRAQKRNGLTPEHIYYTIRAQDLRAKQSLRTQETMYIVEILLDLTCHPNSKTLYNRIKDELIQKRVQFSYNNISIDKSEIDESELIDHMRKIDDQKQDV